MSQETAFKISDWIAKDIAMFAAPLRGHRMAKEEFTLLQQFDLLPSDILSLAKMADFSVPLESPPSSTEQPAHHLGEGVVTHFPLWLLMYWTAILDFKQDVRGYWVRILDWIAKQKKTCKRNPARAALVEETSHIISMLPWGENGGLVRAGDAEKSDAEGETPPSAPLGRGQRKKIGTSRYQVPLWEKH
ncbi:hypothetical protein DFH08DRAFT_808221 [Mycena albidolilacea]|uniref:Uncharacterized protein n=1 Tax=Mycena albidolilacea TaxID=1033008 RepID=A0AAD7A330_9AGAR|nr:hypothetical protein DFH08DRAFT_808221 [Mycena albidolilacea]